MDKSKVSVIEWQGRRYGYAGKYAGTGRKMSLKDVFCKGSFGKLPASCRQMTAEKRGVLAGGAMNGVPSRHALRGEIVEPWEDVERMCSMNQERRRMREALALNQAKMLAAQEAQRVRDRKARRKARLLEGIRTAVTVLLFLIAFYGLLCCMVTQAAGYGLGAAASLLIGGRAWG